MLGVAKAPATCGELIQGNINNKDFLVTCPVNIFSIVTVKLYKERAFKRKISYPKITKAIQKTLECFDQSQLGFQVMVQSNIPQGKGMASSTADISAACAATALALGECITPDEITKIALSIEPSDGIMYHGITLFDHLQGYTVETLGQAPDIRVIVIDLGGQIDTVEFNQNLQLSWLNKQKEFQVTKAVHLLKKGYETNDRGKLVQAIGNAATISAFAHQKILPKKRLQSLIDLCISFGGLGVNVAHSGTVVGMLFDIDVHLDAGFFSELRNQGFEMIFDTTLIDGGVQVLIERDGDHCWTQLSEHMGEISEKQRKRTV